MTEDKQPPVLPPRNQPVTQGRTLYFISGLMLVCVVTLMAMLLLEPVGDRAETPQPGLRPTMTPVIELRATPLPSELLDNQYLTNGIVLGATLMIVLVVIVVLAAITRREHTIQPPP